jgi:hypothetical protein
MTSPHSIPIFPSGSLYSILSLARLRQLPLPTSPNSGRGDSTECLFAWFVRKSSNCDTLLVTSWCYSLTAIFLTPAKENPSECGFSEGLLLSF